jgi:Holliday junction resolvase
MGAASREKGARGERELGHFLTDMGCPARRGQQFQGGPDSPDVVCDALPLIHLECKRVERGSLYEWLDQAIADAGDEKIPVVAHRRNNKEWVAVMRLSDLVDMLKWLT